MPAAPKTSDEAIVRAARKLVDRAGAAELSMQAVADAVDVRAPSLYKRFADRDALLDAVAQQVLEELRALLADAAGRRSPARALAAMAHAYRAFATRHPHLYALVFAVRPGRGPAVAQWTTAVQPVMEQSHALVGAERALPAARLLTSFVHGFVSMELTGAFALGGSLDAAFAFGIDHLLRGLAE